MILITLALLILWYVIITGLSEHYAEQAGLGHEHAALKALSWNSSNGKAALIQSQIIGKDNLTEAKALLTTVLVNDPTNARALATLSNISHKQGNSIKADELINLSSNLAPVDPVIRQAAAVNWVEQGDLTKALENLSAAMSADLSTFTNVFPALLRIAEDNQLRGLLTPYADPGTPWWERFFTKMTRQAANVDTVKAMVSIRLDNSTKPVLTDQERKAYIGRLYKEGLELEAYLSWVNGLDQTQKDHIELIYDGSFETEFSNTGFGWFVRPPKGVLVQRTIGYGTGDGHALRLVFRNFDDRLRNIRQWLLLDPGSFRLSGSVRPDGLKTSGGIKWTITCVIDSSTIKLAETEPFKGSDQWHSFEFEFDVPENCLHLQINLISETRIRADRRINGSIWFDDLHIQRLSF